MFAGRLTPAPEGLIESRPNLRRYSRKWPSDEIAIPAGRADLRLSWRKGVAGRHPRIGSGLSGQASAFYRCSSYTPRLRTFFIVQDASWQARGWARLRSARVGERDSGCAGSSPRCGASGAARSASVLSSLAAAWAPMPETRMPVPHAGTAAPSTADERPGLRWCGWRRERARGRCQPASGMVGYEAEMVRQQAFVYRRTIRPAVTATKMIKVVPVTVAT